MILRILFLTLEWLAISAATIAAAVAIQDGPAWTMPAAGLCALIGGQLRVLSDRRAIGRRTDAILAGLRKGGDRHNSSLGGR